jgi:hypothetical protein
MFHSARETIVGVMLRDAFNVVFALIVCGMVVTALAAWVMLLLPPRPH